VLGNHDHWRDEAEVGEALKRIGVRVLDNDAARAGPLAIGGLDDAFTGKDDVRATVRKMKAVGGVPVLLSHSPDPFATLSADVPLMLAGHTHCGQIHLPLIGPLATESAYGERYACGLMRENDRTLVVSAGLGTSVLPLRIGAAPDMWQITLTGSAAPRR
jgi:predicted MPP superfamily phosphohydrolase